MAIFSIPNVRIAGVAACVPEKIVHNIDYKWISLKERKSLIKNVGVEQKRHVSKGVITSDLCFAAAEVLLRELGWERSEIDLLVFISQSRDYVLPATACVLQQRLGFPKTTAALDVVMGCSAYNYGLSVVNGMMSHGGIKKALMLVGDISSLGSHRDKTTYPLFGDAGTATAMEYREGYPPVWFNLQTDGSGYRAIIIPESGFRKFPTPKTFEYKRYGKGIIRHMGHVVLDGMEVFNFSLREVAPNIKKLLRHVERELDSFDYVVFHQANLLMNETIRKMLKLEKEKVPYSLDRFGNTSSASIPLTLVTELRKELTERPLSLMLTGFGVGLSWGSNIVETDGIVVPELVEYEKFIKNDWKSL
ncbi:MAG: ketoacyl-ACP synthase III [Bacteroidota bacterium]